MTKHTRTQVPRGIAFALALLMSAFTSLMATAPASAAPIVSIGGPLTEITISPDLNCDVRYLGDTAGEWYANTACATLVSAGGVLFGPAAIPAGNAATTVPGYTPFTPVSQTGPTGTGTSADPFTVVTVVDLGTTGLRLTQTDAYVVGEESYRTDVTVTTSGAVDVPVKVYRGGDCFLQDSDFGLGRIDLGIAPLCLAQPGSTDPDRIEGFYPLTGGSHYMEGFYGNVWAAIGSQSNLPDTCDCASLIDNGVAINWDVSVPAGATGITLSSLTIFSPVGAAPVAFAKSADAPSSPAGGTNGYSVTISNPGVVPVTLTSITDTLPAGFSYVAGSTTGATTSEPAVNGQDLTWTGTFVVPAATGGTPGTLSLDFGVTVSTTPGTYTNSVTGSGTGATVIPATDTAPVTVVNEPPTVSAGGPYTGVEDAAISLDGTATDPDADPLTTTWTVDDPSVCSFADPAAVDTSVTCTVPGTYSVTLTASDGVNAPVASTTTVEVAAACVYGAVFKAPFDGSVAGSTVTNTIKNGRVAPIKVSLVDSCTGLPVDPSSTVTIKVSRASGSGSLPDPVETYADAGDSSAGTDEFRLADGFWIYNLDTKALGLTVGNTYRVDVYVDGELATTDTWLLVKPVR